MVKDLSVLPWIILFAPLVAAATICFFAMKSPRLASSISLVGILASLASTLFLLTQTFHSPLPIEVSFSWIQIASLKVDFGFLIDRLSLLMLLVVTGVGSCIFFYSTAYMKDDSSYPRFFASLSLFAFSMIGIVLANNFLMLFVFWELVAVSSYLLIGFWFEKPSAADAGNKAFIVNRVADFGLVLGVFYVWMLSGLGGHDRTFLFTKLSHFIPEMFAQGLISTPMLVIASLLVFCGVVGKSAQFPLYIWLPDAMEGPTPVSALIHAATMVAAGVYLLSRTFFLVSGIHEALIFIAIIGGVTATLAGLLAVVQNDIKKILAYSTVSQLGYMVMALGLGSREIAMFHLTTHAFFKALLFLGAGAMIHALHTQDIWEMGNLLKRMPIAAWTFIFGTLALCGIPPLSGFFSKDEILTLAYEHNKILYGVALFNAFLTAFYMSRLTLIAILGPQRNKKHTSHHASDHNHHFHDAPWMMKTPLLILAFFSIFGGFMGIPEFIHGEHAGHTSINYTIAITSSLVAIAGIAAGFILYQSGKAKSDPLIQSLGSFYQWIVKKYYLDEFFLAIANFFQKLIAQILFWFDLNVVMKKGVGGVQVLTTGFANILRKAQTGRLQNYAMAFGFGVALIIYWVVLKGF